MYRRLYLPILFTLLPSLLLAAPYPQYGGTLRCSIYQKPQSLNPSQLSNYAEFLVASNIYEGLVRLDQNEQIVPALAESWEKSPSNQNWLFYIEESVQFHSGKSVTAFDVKRSWEYLSRTNNLLLNASPLKLIKGYHEFEKGEASEISGLHVVNENTLRLTLIKPVQNFLKLLTLPQMWIFDDSTQKPNGTGPFKLKRQNENEIQLVANENYRWDRTYLDRLTFRYYADVAQSRFDLAVGNLELVFIPSLNAKKLSTDKLTEISHKEQIYLWFNPQTFHRPEWKKAIMYAIDIESILQFQYYINGSSVNTYNPEKALRRLSSTDWSESSEISLAYISLSDNSGRAVAERIKRYLADVNVSIEIISFDNNKSIPDLALLSVYKIDKEIQQNNRELSFLYELPVLVLRSSGVFGLNSYWGGVIVFNGTWIKKNR